MKYHLYKGLTDMFNAHLINTMQGCEFKFRLHQPSLMVISGPTQAGKSSLVRKIILRHEELYDSPIDHIVYCYGASQPEFFDKLASECSKLVFKEGLPDDFSEYSNRPTIYILDDLMQECSKNQDVLNAFVRTSHHSNASIIMLTQAFFFKGLRTLTLNCHYICFFRAPREMSAIRTLGMQMSGSKCECLEEAYRDCCSKPHSYVFIDLSQKQDDSLRIRDDIFADNGCKIYIKK